jgi:hypothetical protein
MLMLGPVLLGLEIAKDVQLLGVLVMLSFTFNSIDLVTASAALIVAILLLADRFIWFVILRPLYTTQRFRIIKNKKFLWSTGLSLIFLPTRLTWHFLLRIIKP